MHLILYFIALFCLSQSPNLVRWAQAPAEVIGFWRMLGACLILVPFIHWKKIKKTHLRWSIFSGIFFFLHLWTFFLAAQNTKIANAMIIYSTNPLFVALGAYLFFKEKFSARMALGYIFAFMGLYLLLSNSFQLSPEYMSGNLWALTSAPLFATYILASQRLREDLGTVTYSALIYSVVSFCFLVVALVAKTPLTHYPSQTWLGITGAIIVPTFMGHFLIAYLFKYLNINFISCGKLIEPVFSTLVAFLLFQEKLSPVAGYAFVLTAAAVLILFVPIKALGPIASTKQRNPSKNYIEEV